MSLVFRPGLFVGLIAFLALSFPVSETLHAETHDGTSAQNGVTLTFQPASLSFGNVPAGNNSVLTLTITNSGTAAAIIVEATISDNAPVFSAKLPALPVTLQPGSNGRLHVKFAPTQSGVFSGTLTIEAHAQGESTIAYFTVPLSGTGTAGTLSANPTSLNFGNVGTGSSQTLNETLTNSSSSTIIVSAANLTGSEFQISGLSLPLTLTSQSNYTFQVTFTPTAVGVANGTISILSDASDSDLQIPLSGTGVAGGTLASNPAILNFGNVNLGSYRSLNANFVASGSSVTMSSVSVNSAEFVVTGISLPLTIPAGQSAPFLVTFTPQTAGAANAAITVASNAADSPLAISLTGTGVSDPPPSVSLSWNASQSQVVGYNVYRSGTSGGPYTRQNSSLDSQTSYVDTDVDNSNTYYYVTTAVNSAGEESVYSNQAQAVLP